MCIRDRAKGAASETSLASSQASDAAPSQASDVDGTSTPPPPDHADVAADDWAEYVRTPVDEEYLAALADQEKHLQELPAAPPQASADEAERDGTPLPHDPEPVGDDDARNEGTVQDLARHRAKFAVEGDDEDINEDDERSADVFRPLRPEDKTEIDS